MTAVLYVLIAVLVFFVVGYFLAKIGCASGERYLSETPVDPVTEDSGSCEDPEILANQQKRREAAEAEAQRIRDEAANEEAAREAAAKEEADAKIHAEEAAKREAEEKSTAKKAPEEKGKSAPEEKKEEVTVKAQTAKTADTKEVSTEAAAKENKKTQVEAEVAKTAVQQETKTKAKSSSDTETATVVAPEGLLNAPRDGKKDNLTRIKGIGVKIDQALNSIGIWHFDQIAVWTEENMAWADRELAFPGRAKRDDWVGQAKLLAEGKETEFSKRVDKGEVASSKKA